MFLVSISPFFLKKKLVKAKKNNILENAYSNTNKFFFFPF